MSAHTINYHTLAHPQYAKDITTCNRSDIKKFKNESLIHKQTDTTISQIKNHLHTHIYTTLNQLLSYINYISGHESNATMFNDKVFNNSYSTYQVDHSKVCRRAKYTSIPG